MAKYVCDFDQVNMIANKITSHSENMIGFANVMLFSVKKELCDWKGKASSEYITSLENKKNDLDKHIDLSIELAKFLVNSADAISSLESELATLTI